MREAPCDSADTYLNDEDLLSTSLAAWEGNVSRGLFLVRRRAKSPVSFGFKEPREVLTLSMTIARGQGGLAAFSQAIRTPGRC